MECFCLTSVGRPSLFTRASAPACKIARIRGELNEQEPTCGPGLAEGLPPFSDNSFSFTSFIATITLLSACRGRIRIMYFLCYVESALHTFTFSSSFGRKSAPRLLAFPPFCMALQDSAEKINVRKEKFWKRKRVFGLTLTEAFHPLLLRGFSFIFLVPILQLGLREPVPSHSFVLHCSPFSWSF